MTAKVILNPYSARWDAGKRQPEMEAALRAMGVDFELVRSEGPDHGVELAAQAVKDGFSPIIAAGGDGTISEVVNGMLRAAGQGTPPPLGVMPLGTANDLVNNLGMPTDLEGAARLIAADRSRPMDVCQVNERYFVNNAGIGLEPYVTSIQARMTKVRGIARYLLATLTAINHNPQWTMKLAWDDGEFEGPITLVSIGNFPLTGGIFYTVPHADGFDGKLSFVYGYLPSRGKILRVLPQTMKPGEGNYVEHPAVHEVHCTWLKVSVNPGSPAHADGELFSLDATELDYRVHPARINILTHPA